MEKIKKLVLNVKGPGWLDREKMLENATGKKKEKKECQ